MTEQIGNITLDYSCYPGEDLYCDGAVEDELLELARTHKNNDFDRIIEERSSWPILYHLSPLRANIIDWIPMDKNAKVLEVGSGCGAITGKLSEKAGSVTCVDLSKKRSHINAYRHQEKENVLIHVGHFKDIEKNLESDFDFIFLIGVFEYAKGYMGSDTPYEDFMQILLKHLKPGGHMVIAIENKLGLKYFAGAKEDHLGDYFSGIENYPRGGGVHTFTRKGLEKICESCGVTDYSFYYPYPDYKFPTTIFSDRRLPKVGELSNNFRNFDRERLLLFDEKNAFDSMIEEGLFDLYSNSYLLMIGKEIPISYSKFSNDRKEEYCIRTDIIQNQQMERYVEKVALNEKAKTHIDAMVVYYEKLQKRYAGSKLNLNRLEQTEQGLRFEYLEGKTLEELLDELLKKEDYDGFEQLFQQYLDWISYGEGSGIADYDLIFPNIVINEQGQHVIDYEWTFEKDIPARTIAYRALYCYEQGVEKRKYIAEELIQKKLGIKSDEREQFRQEEALFQAEITGDRLSMGEIRNRIGYPIISPVELVEKHKDKLHKMQVQIYEDFGDGFSEAQSFFVKNAYNQDDLIVLDIEIKGQRQALRIDPALSCCMVQVLDFKWNGDNIAIHTPNCKYNGKKVGAKGIVFGSDDPNITLKLKDRKQNEVNRLTLSMKVTLIPVEMGRALQDKMSMKRFF
jgi:2-polyprenyl-3-methyl-5-hydroxy-6-metoxy-1,4-benzoquinol methylase